MSRWSAAERAARTGRRSRFPLLGRVPRWLRFGLLAGALVAVLVFVVAPTVTGPSAQVRTIVEGLRSTSVYVAPGAPPLVDAARARQVVGDRPIVVVLLDNTPLPADGGRYDLCQQIAEQTPTNLVLVFARQLGRDDGKYDSSICEGPQFANPDYPVDADDFDTTLIVQAETAWKYRVSDTDLTPQIEEYVLAFDTQAGQSAPKVVPRRAIIPAPPPTPSPVQAGELVLAVVGLVLAVVSVFALLKLAAVFSGRRFSRRSHQHTANAEVSARLSGLADVVLHPPQVADAAAATRQADLARRYVLVLQRFDDEGGTADVAADVGRLEQAVRS